MYDTNQLIAYEGKVYERLFDHPMSERYRVIIDDDDYDYVEDKDLCDLLDTLPTL